MFRTTISAVILATSIYGQASALNIDKTYVQTEKGNHFFTLELNTVIDQETAQQLKVTDSDGKPLSGTVELLVNGTALKTSAVRFYPAEQDCFKKIVTLSLGDTATRIVPGTSGIASVGGAALKSAGLAYSTEAAGALANAYVGGGVAGGGIGVLDVVPRPGTQDASPYAPILVFFGDIVDSDTVNSNNFELIEEATGEQVSGQVGFSTSTAGNTIVSFTPNSPLKKGTAYKFIINSELADQNLPIWQALQEIGIATEPKVGDTDPETKSEEQILAERQQVIEDYQQQGGTPIINSLIWMPIGHRETSFATGAGAASAASLATNMDFKQLNLEGYTTSGNALVIDTLGSLRTTTVRDELGTNPVAAVTTFGNAGGAAGSLVSAEIQVPADAQWLSFDTNFVTAEFPNYVGSIFDDTFLVSIHTPFGTQTINAASVNSLGLFKVNPAATGAPGLVGSLDKFALVNGEQLPGLGDQSLQGETTWHTRAFYVGGLAGQTIRLSFHVTNVGDNVYQSMALIDNIRFGAQQPALRDPALQALYSVVSSGKVAESPVPLLVTKVGGGESRKDRRYLLAKVDGTDAYKLTLFTTLDQSESFYGAKSGDDIVLYRNGDFADKQMVLRKTETGFAVHEQNLYLNEETYDMAPLEAAVANKRKELAGGGGGVIPEPIVPLPDPNLPVPEPVLPLPE